MNKKLFKITCWIAIIVGSILLGIAGFQMFLAFVLASGEWADISRFLAVIIFLATSVLFVPFILAGKNGLKHLEKGSNINKSLFHNIVGILLLLWFLRSYVYRDSLRQFEISTAESYANAKMTYTLIVGAFILPLIINVIELIKEKAGIKYKEITDEEKKEKIRKVFSYFKYVLCGIVVILLLFGAYKGIKFGISKINEVSVTEYKMSTNTKDITIR